MKECLFSFIFCFFAFFVFIQGKVSNTSQPIPVNTSQIEHGFHPVHSLANFTHILSIIPLSTTSVIHGLFSYIFITSSLP